MSGNQVAVIGGGVSGLVTAKVLRNDGFDVSIFEKASEIGGVWAESRAYPGLRTNSPSPLYTYSDFAHSEATDEFPTARQLRTYLNDYVDHFALREYLHLGTEIISVNRGQPDGAGHHPGFEARIRNVADGTEAQSQRFDFVAVCNGVLSDPYVPELEGSRQFSGDILHSSGIRDASLLVGKRVLVLGAGKSALDCASLAGTEADACTLVFRQPYWMLPRYFGRTRVDKLVYSRWSEKMSFPAYHQSSRTEKLLRGIGAPLLSLFRQRQQSLIARASRMPDYMVPEAPIHASIYHLGIGSDIYQHLQSGRVKARRCEIDRFMGDRRIRLSNGEEIEADLVICATGWRRDLSFLGDELQKTIMSDGQFRLYRHILPPSQQRIGFIGYASSTNSPLTSEISAHWLSQHFLGKLPLPAVADMEKSVDEVLEWTSRHFPNQREGHFIGGYVSHYTDWLLQDMGLDRRRCRSLASEYLHPFESHRYMGLGEERSRCATR